ncbi:MAG TPA: PKD domain-containing protein, partial [Chitinophagaceae bacterium]|nr:PKD domain-containing protein [Chitinophagaceae bacterium]
ISSAGGGTNCWVVGGLTGSSYTSLEASCLQSPCFDFTNLQYPYIEFKVNWETEQQFDGGSFQYSLDNGSTWMNVGSANNPINCLNQNWFNYSPINYLSSFSSSRDGWSGNIQTGGGGCKSGNGSNGWLIAKHTMPYLSGKTGVLFRFVFGAGSICNNYDGFAIDDILIGEAPPNATTFTYTCANNNRVSFTNVSSLCPGLSWDFGDPASGANNSSSAPNPTHVFSAPGKYTVTLSASGPGNAPSIFTDEVDLIGVEISMQTAVDCQTNTGGSLIALAGPGGPFNYTWNTNPVQTGSTATYLSEGFYTVTVTGSGVCPVTATGKAEKDLSCIGVFFPSGFTPDNNSKNDGFGPLGSLLSMTNYQLSIYNRWGERVFYSRDPFERWKGIVRGVKTDGNIFVWLATYSLPGKGKEFKKGTVILIR